MSTLVIAGGGVVVGLAMVPTIARCLSKVLPANNKPGTPPSREIVPWEDVKKYVDLVDKNIKKAA